VTLSTASFILTNEGGGLITKLVAAGYGDDNIYQALLAVQTDTDPSISGIVTNDFLDKLASCPATSEIFTTKLRDYLDTAAQNVTAVSKAAVPVRKTITINTSADTFILSDEGGGLITELVAAGYGNYSPYQALLVLREEADPSITSVLPDAFLNALAAEPASAEIFTHTLTEYTGKTIAISTNGTVQTVSIYGRTYLGATGTNTMASNISGVGNAEFTYSSPLVSFSVTASLITTDYMVFAIGWAPSTTASIAISTDCTVQAVNIYGSAYLGAIGTNTLVSTITGAGSADFTYATSSVSPLIRWLLTGTYYDAFAIGWLPSK
jgi:hypothetical protein